jgi:hypothetical protein
MRARTHRASPGIAAFVRQGGPGRAPSRDRAGSADQLLDAAQWTARLLTAPDAIGLGGIA